MHNRASRLVFAILGVSLLLASASAFGATGVLRWEQNFRSPTDGLFSAAPLAARELADGTVLVVTQDFQTIHYNHDGTIVSAMQLPLTPAERAQESSPSGTFNAKAVIDGFGRVVLSRVALRNYSPRDSGVVETVKFDGLTGESLWQAPAFYDAHLAEYPTAVFVDRFGDVVVTGVASGNQKHFTLKYDGRSGALLWGPNVLDNLMFPTLRTTASMDLDGNVYVSVPSNVPGGLLTLKYLAADGSLAWGPVVLPGEFAQPNASLIGPDGNLVVAAASDDLSGAFVVVKFDAGSGALVWGPSEYPTPQGASNAEVSSLVANAAGDLFLTGSYSLSGLKIVSRKLSGGTGETLWTGVPTDARGDLPGTDLAANGDLVVASVIGTSVDPRIGFRRYRGTDGATVWGPSEFGAFYGSDPPVFFVGSNGRIFVSALAFDESAATTALSSGELDAATGAPAWGPTEASFPRQFVTEFVDLAAGPDGNPVVTGRTRGPTSAAVTLKYERATGNLLWGPITYSPPGSFSLPQQIVVDSANDAYVLASETTDDGNAFDVFVIKYSGATGAVLWGPTRFDELSEAIRLALDPGENVMLLAWKPDLDTFVFHPAVAKVSGATGAVLWGPVAFGDGTSENAYARDLALDAAGNAIVVGTAQDWFVLKYASADGALLWGPKTLSMAWANAVAVDAAGNVVVTGGDVTSTMNTVKYSGANGAVLWGPKAIATAEGDAVAIAPNGDVVAAGQFVQTFNDIDFVTIRYKSSDGSVVWGPVVTDGDGHGNDVVGFETLGFDGTGNVVLGGSSERPNGNNDISLVKYAGMTGAILWGPVYVGGPDTEQIAGFEVEGNSIAVGATSDAGMLTAVVDESLGIQTAILNLPPAFCGQAYAFSFVAQNGSPGYAWSVVAGALPEGLTLSSGGALSGTPTEQGTFTFTVRVTDSALAHADREFMLVVTEDPGDIAILALPGPSCHFTLAVPPGFSSYLWLPGGETTSTIDVAPIERTTYGVVVGDGSGCLLHLSVELGGTALQDPSCLAPSVVAISPTSGPASGGTPVTLDGGNFQPGAQLEVGGQAVSATVNDPSQITASTPPLSPGTLNDVVVVNPDSGNAALLRGFLADFLDVPPSNIFHDSIEKLFRRGVTAGCDLGVFCPDADTTRAQMAVFLLKSLLGSSYVPPPATGGIFGDVYPGVFAADWIEDLYSRGITTGCQIDPPLYCPDANISRAEMAVFLLKTLLGSGYVPPAATGTVFEDVAAGDFAAAWIEDLYNRGLTAGCQAMPRLYCPNSPVSRGEMAAFLVNTFGL